MEAAVLGSKGTAPGAEVAQSAKTRVFISYSRNDGIFVRRVAETLAARGYEPDFDQSFFDPTNIAMGISAEDEWWLRLQDMIAAADIMVFVVSPDSAASKICDEEIAYARGMGKRIIPILRSPIDFAKTPPRLAALNIKIQFLDDSDASFAASLAELCAALDVDVVWHRESKRLTGLAIRWDQRGRPDDLLVTAADVRAIGDLLERRPKSAPEQSAILLEMRDRSRARLDFEARFRRRMQTSVVFLLVGVIIGLVGWINQQLIKEQWRWYTVTRPYMLSQFRPSVLSVQAERALKQGETFRECAKDCPEMIVVPAGSFMMGSPDTERGRNSREEPLHRVTIANPLAISKYEVRFAAWDACAAYGNCDPDIEDSGFGRGNQPVINVNWNDAHRYAAWLSQMTGKNYRILSEAEYEYAARAGRQTAYPWGDEIGTNNAVCTSCGSRWDNMRPAPVGSFAPNRFGLYDMVGNTWEWVEDCVHPDYNNGAPTDASAWIQAGDCKERVVRGGSWSDPPEFLRSAARQWDPINDRYYRLNFRVVRTLVTH
jgi:formylglycine-generating enzyme required for sulfatase activity